MDLPKVRWPWLGLASEVSTEQPRINASDLGQAGLIPGHLGVARVADDVLAERHVIPFAAHMQGDYAIVRARTSLWTQLPPVGEWRRGLRVPNVTTFSQPMPL
jgi:hypothetical protein